MWCYIHVPNIKILYLVVLVKSFFLCFAYINLCKNVWPKGRAIFEADDIK